MSAPRRPRPALPSLLSGLALSLLLAIGWLLGPVPAASASLENDRYDGNIYALYAGNGSLVPPRSTVAEARAQGRVSVIVYFLDDSSASKRFAPVVSELQRVWGQAIELIPLATDPLQNRADGGPDDPAHYWKGLIPQVVVLDREGRVAFDASGPVSVDAINAAVSRATGIALPESRGVGATLSFNELNAEVVSAP